LSQNLTEKIIKEHLIEGEMDPGKEVSIAIDQTLTQDATGTMAYLQFEALGLPKVKTKLSVSYVDHNMLQTGFENADDHRYLQSVAAKYGVHFSRPGNGICHQVHLERFAAPGATLLGSDSHTPNAGAMGMLAIGAGGLDVALAMSGRPFYMEMPKVVGVKLVGELAPWTSAKDAILELLLRLSVRGGTGKVIEYYGDGVGSLSIPERATITNMGAELGATCSVFPSDEKTKEFLTLQKRSEQWKPLEADQGASYDEEVEIDLSSLEPMIAKPTSPDNVVPVSEIEGMEIQQVLVGSCNNSSYKDLMTVASMLKGKKIHPNVAFGISPGSRQVLDNIAENGALATIVKAGTRILECGCGGCIGMGQAPPTGAVSLRTYNRNFPGRSGTKGDTVYLCSPEVAVASAISGVISDPRNLADPPRIDPPERLSIDDSMILPPSKNPEEITVARGPNIKPLPTRGQMDEEITGKVLIKTGDNVSTDEIMPAGAKILPLRSNIPAISEYVFSRVDSDFVKRAKENKGGIIVGGVNYGQGSSREHAALAPMYLGVKAVLAKSFARIHRSNLINFGILPLEFADEAGYGSISPDDALEIKDVINSLKTGTITVVNIANNEEIKTKCEVKPRELDILLAGGALNLAKASMK